MVEPRESIWSMSKLFGPMLWNDRIDRFDPCLNCLGACCHGTPWLHLYHVHVVWVYMLVWPHQCMLNHVRLAWADYTVRPYQFINKHDPPSMGGWYDRAQPMCIGHVLTIWEQDMSTPCLLIKPCSDCLVAWYGQFYSTTMHVSYRWIMFICLDAYFGCYDHLFGMFYLFGRKHTYISS